MFSVKDNTLSVGFVLIIYSSLAHGPAVFVVELVDGRLVFNDGLAAGNKVYVADSTLKIISKLTVKGDVEELWCDHILTVVGNSFFYYGYEPNASIHIYKIEKREK